MFCFVLWCWGLTFLAAMWYNGFMTMAKDLGVVLDSQMLADGVVVGSVKHRVDQQTFVLHLMTHGGSLALFSHNIARVEFYPLKEFDESEGDGEPKTRVVFVHADNKGRRVLCELDVAPDVALEAVELGFNASDPLARNKRFTVGEHKIPMEPLLYVDLQFHPSPGTARFVFRDDRDEIRTPIDQTLVNLLRSSKMIMPINKEVNRW